MPRVKAGPQTLAVPIGAPRPALELRGPEAFRVWLRFLRLDQRLRLLMGRCLRGVGLSIPQFDVLSALSSAAGITQRQLAQQLYVTKGNVSGLIDRLVQARLVERRRGAQDRRAHALFLTATGKKAAADGFAAQRAFVERTLGRLPQEDLAALHLLLGRWRDAAREAEAESYPMVGLEGEDAGAGQPD